MPTKKSGAAPQAKQSKKGKGQKQSTDGLDSRGAKYAQLGVGSVTRSIFVENPVICNNETIAELMLPTTKDGTVTGSFWLLPAALSWLNWIAPCYSSYRWLHVRVGYQTMVGTQTNGMLGLSRSHDIRDDVPKSVAEVLTSSGGCVWPVHSTCMGGTNKLGSKWADNQPGWDLTPAQLKQSGRGGWIEYASLTTINSLPVAERDRCVDFAINWLTTGGDGVGLKCGVVWISYAIELTGPCPPKGNK